MASEIIQLYINTVIYLCLPILKVAFKYFYIHLPILSNNQQSMLSHLQLSLMTYFSSLLLTLEILMSLMHYTNKTLIIFMFHIANPTKPMAW